MLIDSHCHLNYLDDPDAALDLARERGVSGFLCIGVDESGIDEVLAFAEGHADVWATVGLHPEAAGADLGYVRKRAAHDRVVALGEMGLDYFRLESAELKQIQRHAFDAQLSLADELGMPVVIHTRQAEADTLASIAEYPNVKGVLHCFTESWAMAKTAIDHGYYVSISGIATFKNGSNVRDVAKRVPLDRLLVETDSPWLAPVPYRGKQNQPAYVCETAEFVADLRGIDASTLARATCENFCRLFGVSP